MPSLFYLFIVCLLWRNPHVLQLFVEVRGQFAVWGSVLSFLHLGPGDGTWVLRLDCKSLYQLSHLAGPNLQMLTALIFSSRTQ